MARKTVSELQSYFETGDTPTTSNFVDLIDSTYNSLTGLNETSGFTNLSVTSLSANDINVGGLAGLTHSITLSTFTGSTTLIFVGGVLTEVVC